MSATWPELSARDRPTIVALHLFSQIAGKVPTALLPWRNHGWHLTLHVTPRGLATEPIHAETGTFTLALDLVDHLLVYRMRRRRVGCRLRPMPVANFHAAGARYAAGGRPRHPHRSRPERDRSGHPLRRGSGAARLRSGQRPPPARRLVQADRVFRLFRSSFLGKVSPVHFFWGSFDLAVTRFSGRPAPLHPGGIPNLPDAVTREAYSHEVSSAGFWPGGAGGEGGPFFYSYAYPSPDGFAEAKVAPDAARFDAALGEFILDYEAVRAAAGSRRGAARLSAKQLCSGRRSWPLGSRRARMRARHAGRAAQQAREGAHERRLPAGERRGA